MIQLLLFDLGNVIIDFAGPRELGQFMRVPAPPEEILKRWSECPHVKALESGEISTGEWAERFIVDWHVDLDPDALVAEFTTWCRAVLPGARELLTTLRPRFRLAALSNSNAAHWERNTNELRVLELFDFAVGSHQIGVCKPDPAIFKAALRLAQLPPDEVMFFDDMPANVEAAAALGMHARRAEGVDGVRSWLVREGLLA